MIKYVAKSLFDTPGSFVLAHACNCKGVWGSGIAVEFKDRFPAAFDTYRLACTEYASKLLGYAYLILDAGDGDLGPKVACLFTSDGYGEQKDKPELIVHNTRLAMADLFRKTNREVAIPKINSGKFGVPWELTEAELLKFNRDIYVYTGG